MIISWIYILWFMWCFVIILLVCVILILFGGLNSVSTNQCNRIIWIWKILDSIPRTLTNILIKFLAKCFEQLFLAQSPRFPFTVKSVRFSYFRWRSPAILRARWAGQFWGLILVTKYKLYNLWSPTSVMKKHILLLYTALITFVCLIID